MEFLESGQLRTKFVAVLASKGPAKIAIAYWGKGALRLLDLDPQRRDIQVLCCLQGGKSDPDVIEQFGKRAHQHDRLHAKVIWTASGAR